MNGKRGKFTREQAIVICQRNLPPHRTIDDLPTNCRDCYFFDSRCEITGEKNPHLCEWFMFDDVTTNRVRCNILHDRKWCLEHWESLCGVDKELYRAIYGLGLFIGL